MLNNGNVICWIMIRLSSRSHLPSHIVVKLRLFGWKGTEGTIALEAETLNNVVWCLHFHCCWNNSPQKLNQFPSRGIKRAPPPKSFFAEPELKSPPSTESFICNLYDSPKGFIMIFIDQATNLKCLTCTRWWFQLPRKYLQQLSNIQHHLPPERKPKTNWELNLLSFMWFHLVMICIWDAGMICSARCLILLFP